MTQRVGTLFAAQVLDPDFKFQHPHKKLSMASHANNSCGGQRQESHWGLWQACFRFYELFLKGMRQRAIEQDTYCSPLASDRMCTQVHAHMQTACRVIH